MFQINPRVSSAIRERLGSLYVDLVRVLFDLGTPPIFMWIDNRDRLVRVRDNAQAKIDAWAEAAHDEVSELYDLVPLPIRETSRGESLLVAAVWGEYHSLPRSIFLPPGGDSPVLRLAPNLSPHIDNDGLLHLDGFDARPHGLFVDELALHYHQLLRRGFGSNIHYELAGAIITAGRNPSIQARMAIDEQRVRYRQEYQEFHEFDYWYGPPLSEAKLDDPHSVGETVHGDPDEGRSILNPYTALFIRWSCDDALKTVEIEEMCPILENGDDLILARYLHAIRDIRRHAFIHCDGAVKAFDKTAYPRSVGQFRTRGKGVHYRKVFRLDGEIDTELWSNITSQWFRGNRLILEYLGGGS